MQFFFDRFPRRSPKTPLRHPKTIPRRPKTAPRRPKTPPRRAGLFSGNRPRDPPPDPPPWDAPGGITGGLRTPSLPRREIEAKARKANAMKAKAKEKAIRRKRKREGGNESERILSHADRSADDGKRFCDLIARGTLYEGWLRRITYINTELREQKGGGRLHRRNGWRMTGSAFARYERCGTLWMRVASQDILTSVLNRAREQVVPDCIRRKGWRMTGSACRADRFCAGVFLN